jgi:hypothetical protein
VKISDVRITGSDPEGLFMNATIAASIKNPTEIDIIVSFTVSTFYRETKVLI